MKRVASLAFAFVALTTSAAAQNAGLDSARANLARTEIIQTQLERPKPRTAPAPWACTSSIRP